MRKEFVNDFDRNVIVDVKVLGDGSVMIEIVGPTSMTTNIVTPMEAKVLLECLSSVDLNSEL